MAAVVFLGVPLMVYAALLAGNALSAWRISKVLNRLEQIRVGDPAPTLFKTIEGCAIKQSGSEYDCQIYHFPLQFQWLDAAFAKLPDEATWDDRLRRLGLREQYLSVSATIHRERSCVWMALVLSLWLASESPQALKSPTDSLS